MPSKKSKKKSTGGNVKGIQTGFTKAFSRVNRSVRLQPVDPHSGKVIYKETVVVFPDEPTAIKNALFNLLKKQNPTLISDKPYSAKTDPEITREKKYQDEAGLKIVEGKPMSQKEIDSQGRFINASRLSAAHAANKEQIKNTIGEKDIEKAEVDQKEPPVPEPPKENPQDFVLALAEFSEIPDIAALSPDEIKAFSGKLGFNLLPGDKASQLQQLNDRASVLTAQLAELQKKATKPKE